MTYRNPWGGIVPNLNPITGMDSPIPNTARSSEYGRSTLSPQNNTTDYRETNSRIVSPPTTTTYSSQNQFTDSRRSRDRVDLSPSLLKDTCCYCFDIRVGTVILSYLTAIAALLTIINAFNSNDTFSLIYRYYGIALLLLAVWGLYSIYIKSMSGIKMYGIVFALAAVCQTALCLYGIIDGFSNRTTSKMFTDCQAKVKNSNNNTDCDASMNAYLTNLVIINVVVILVAAYFAYIVYRFSRAYIANPDQYAYPISIFSSITADNPFSSSSAASTLAERQNVSRRTPPADQSSPQVTYDLPEYQPPLPEYKDVVGQQSRDDQPSGARQSASCDTLNDPYFPTPLAARPMPPPFEEVVVVPNGERRETPVVVANYPPPSSRHS